MGLTLLDTGAVIGFLDADDAFHAASHAEIATAMREGTFFCMAAVSYAELLTDVGLGHHDLAVVESFLSDFSVGILAVDEVVAEEAARLRSAAVAKGRAKRAGATARLRMPDALILATAAVTPAIDRVLVADARWPKVDLGGDVDVRLLAAA